MKIREILIDLILAQSGDLSDTMIIEQLSLDTALTALHAAIKSCAPEKKEGDNTGFDFTAQLAFNDAIDEYTANIDKLFGKEEEGKDAKA